MVFSRMTVSRSTVPAPAHSVPLVADRTWLADPVGVAAGVDAAFLVALPQPARPATPTRAARPAAAIADRGPPQRPAPSACRSLTPIAHLVPGPVRTAAGAALPRWTASLWTVLAGLRFPAAAASYAAPAAAIMESRVADDKS